jgi:hypothetical protein
MIANFRLWFYYSYQLTASALSFLSSLCYWFNIWIHWLSCKSCHHKEFWICFSNQSVIQHISDIFFQYWIRTEIKINKEKCCNFSNKTKIIMLYTLNQQYSYDVHPLYIYTFHFLKILQQRIIVLHLILLIFLLCLRAFIYS